MQGPRKLGPHDNFFFLLFVNSPGLKENVSSRGLKNKQKIASEVFLIIIK